MEVDEEKGGVRGKIGTKNEELATDCSSFLIPRSLFPSTFPHDLVRFFNLIPLSRGG
jgi:hypothetical protein